jgi:putative intracellular protease/amidase
MQASKGAIALLIEEHFDVPQFHAYQGFFPRHGYGLECVSYLWGQPQLRFCGNPQDGAVREHVVVTRDLLGLDPAQYAGVLCIGAYAMDRLRFQPKVEKGRPNQAPAVVFVRRALELGNIPVGTVDHALWLLTADHGLLRGRKVTCIPSILCDVENAGGEVVYDAQGVVAVHRDGMLVSARDGRVLDRFLETFLQAVEERAASAVAR